MGIELKVTVGREDSEVISRMIEKSLSLHKKQVTVLEDGAIEVRFTAEQSMPDICIWNECDGVIFLYNSGYEKSWSVFGTLVSYLASFFDEVKVEEL
jgi:hypothetical protein